MASIIVTVRGSVEVTNCSDPLEAIDRVFEDQDLRELLTITTRDPTKARTAAEASAVHLVNAPTNAAQEGATDGQQESSS